MMFGRSAGRSGEAGMWAVVKLRDYLWRPLTDSDADTAFVVKLRNQDRFSRMFYQTKVTPDGHRRFIRAADERGDEINWLIESRADGTPLGLSSIYHIDRGNRKCECGRVAMLAPKLFHMNWVVTAFVTQEVMGLFRLYIETLEENSVVARGLDRIGMVREGLMRGHVFRDGKPLNVWLFSGTSEDWKKLRGPAMKKYGRPELVSYQGWEVSGERTFERGESVERER
jgi:RimJ/RimL family protein N-acetyltransferase